MNYIDYENWAEEYRQQVEILDRKLFGRYKRQFFPSPEARTVYENTTRILEEMRRECVKTYITLRKRARKIKEDEQYGKNFIAQ